MAKKFITFRGRRALAEWPEKLKAAQRQTTVMGKERIRFGSEENDVWGASAGPCHDCYAEKGEFHVPGCDGERCPVCKGQIISCECAPPGFTIHQPPQEN